MKFSNEGLMFKFVESCKEGIRYQVSTYYDKDVGIDCECNLDMPEVHTFDVFQTYENILSEFFVTPMEEKDATFDWFLYWTQANMYNNMYGEWIDDDYDFKELYDIRGFWDMKEFITHFCKEDYEEAKAIFFAKRREAELKLLQEQEEQLQLQLEALRTKISNLQDA